jgi:Cytochrome P450
MVCYPEIQKEAQAELDQVLDGRLPEHSDIVSLPYLSALIKEVYRYAGFCFKNSFLQVHAKLFLILLDGNLYFH